MVRPYQGWVPVDRTGNKDAELSIGVLPARRDPRSPSCNPAPAQVSISTTSHARPLQVAFNTIANCTTTANGWPTIAGNLKRGRRTEKELAEAMRF